MNQSFTHKVLLDNRSFSAKPTGGAAKGISYRLPNNQKELPINEIAKAVGTNGQTFTPAFLEGGRTIENWKSQSIFCLDFDCGIDFLDVMERAQDLALGITFAYETFRSTPEHQRLRVIWQLDYVVTDIEEWERIMYFLHTISPEADQNCRERSRFFYGGKGLLYENYAYVLDIDRLEEAAEEARRRYSWSGEGEEEGQDGEYSGKNVQRYINTNSDAQKSGSILENGYSGQILHVDSPSLGHTLTQSPNDVTAPSLAPDTIDRPNFERLRKRVKIFDDFLSGKKLKHQQLRGIASALRFMKGGQKKFRDTIKANLKKTSQSQTGYDEEKQEIIRYAKKDNWPIFHLNSFSPYESDWAYKNLYRAAKYNLMVRHHDFEGESFPAVRKKLEAVWAQILAEKGQIKNPIHIIKAATGLGKTRLYESLLSDALIALPDHAIKNEIRTERMKARVLSTPNVDDLPSRIKEKIIPLYEIGATAAVNEILKEAADNLQVSQYRNDLFECYETSNTVLTTHQKGIHIKDWKQSLVIFDEDPFTRLFPTSHVKIEDLQKLTKLVDGTAKSQLQALLSQLAIHEDTIEDNPIALNINEYNELYSQVLENKKKFSSNILGFINCCHWTVDPQDASKIHFISRYELPEDKTVVILSATANEEFYRKLYGQRVRFHDMSKVVPTSFIEQHTHESMSRSSLRNNFEWAQKRLGDLPVITFKDHKKYFPNAVEDIHFGKCTGFDDLKGQDLAVVGSYHLPPFAVALYGAALGVFEAGLSIPKPQGRTVTHNGFSFPFTTYEDSELQAIQFHIIESELRQAIGRARPYTESARVVVLSNYPLPEAHIVGVDPAPSSIQKAKKAIWQGDLGDVSNSGELVEVQTTHDSNQQSEEN